MQMSLHKIKNIFTNCNDNKNRVKCGIIHWKENTTCAAQCKMLRKITVICGQQGSANRMSLASSVTLETCS